ncbi:MAG: OmpA family protein [Myxococcales bacterium]|nr:OmpA family protein [Myxococcales bacterium]
MTQKRHTFALAALALSGAFAFGVGCTAKATTGEPAAPTASTTAPVASTPPPPPDKDGDGVADADDACPDQAGKANADKAKNGCPDAPPPPVNKNISIEGNEVKIIKKIMFKTGSAEIEKESDQLLNDIAEFLKGDGKVIDLLEVAGHADKTGDAKKNLKLTDDRAKSVVDALVKRGVDATKLRAKGYGPYCPVDPGETPDALERNRRVQFAILKMGGKKTGFLVGCAEAAKNGVKPQPIF